MKVCDTVLFDPPGIEVRVGRVIEFNTVYQTKFRKLVLVIRGIETSGEDRKFVR